MQHAMSMRNRIAPHLPHLRRYARALAGSQEKGDNLVRLVLEVLVETPGALPDGPDPKVALFQLFHGYHDPRQRKFARLENAALPYPERQAMLLTMVEGFSLAQAAEILGETEHLVEAAIINARAAIAEMIRSRVLIIEDEPLIAMHLEQMMEDMGHSVLANATTCEEAVRAAKADAPDLILADIQLADGSSGIDAVNMILQQLDVPVVFITAFPERLLTGKPSEPAFLVTKPFAPDAVLATVSQALLARLSDLAPLA